MAFFGQRIRWWIVATALGCGLVAGTPGGVHARPQEEIPARFLPVGGYAPPTIDPLREPSRWTAGPAPTTLTPAGHAAALRADALAGKAFWVEEVLGAPDAPRTIVVIPQFHRSDTQPIDWSSLGEEIRGVQRNIDTLVTRLVLAHNLACIATEGSALNAIDVPMELKQLATWNRDLQSTYAAAEEAFGARGEEILGPLRTVRVLLDDALKKRLVLLDGTGVALSRLPEDVRSRVRRLGLENLALNQKGVEILRAATAVEEQLALLEPSTQSTSADVMGVMWLDEFPAHKAAVLDPFDTSLETLDAERKKLLGAGADDAADILRRFVSRAKLLGNGLVRSDDIRSYHRYYAQVEARALDAAVDAGTPAAVPKVRRLTAKERRQKKRLMAKRDRLWAEYAKVTERDREAFAAKRVVSALPKSDGSVCALVMGANHTEAVAKAILAESAATKSNIGVIVVAPFHFD